MTTRRQTGILSILAVILALGTLITAPTASAAPAQVTYIPPGCEYYITADGRTANARCVDETAFTFFRFWVTACGVSSCQQFKTEWYFQGPSWQQFTPGGWITAFNGFDLL